MYLPQKYANMFLGENFTPSCAYEVMMAAVAANRVEIACAPLIDWLWTTCTQVQLTNGEASEALTLAQAPNGAFS